jgi:plastocyanin
MGYDTIFYICGAALAVLAVVTSFIGLKSEKFPGKASPVVALVFLALIGVTATYAVLNGQEEQEARAQELEQAGEEFEAAEEDPVAEEEPAEQGAAQGGGEAKAPVSGPGGTLQLEASPTDIAYDTTELSSQPGEVTIDFTNPAVLEHDVAIEKDGEEIAGSDLISKGKTSVTADLGPGDYVFYCTVPGHREAGMEGTLTVR